MDFLFAEEPNLLTEEFIDVLQRSTLGQRRPIGDSQRIDQMLANADVIITARTAEGRLIGVSRAITDFVYCTYLSDLAVDVDFQRQGIGRRLIDETHGAAGLVTKLILLAAPASTSYYPHVGFAAHPSCWVRPVPTDD